MEKCADDLDRAAQLEEQERQQGRAALSDTERRRRAAVVKSIEDGDYDGKHCRAADCGEELPASRIKDNRTLCTSCQSLAELKIKQQRR